MFLLLLLAAFFLASATIIEHKYNTQTAFGLVYNAWYFELLLFLLCINLFGAIIIKKLYVKQKIHLFFLHTGWIIIIIGAAFTRYTGYSGTIHIRESDKTNKIILNTINNTGYKTLPFTIKLDSFNIERYPGSNSPSSFASYVKIYENGETPYNYHIYMNNVLKIKGFRIFQSSYDSDEKGTILSVTYDVLGTTITYAGYLVLFISIVLTLLKKLDFLPYKKIIRKKAALFVLPLLCCLTINATPINQPDKVIDKGHANNFGQILMQNPKGRTCPVSTYASDILRKLYGSDKFEGLTPMQVLLEINIDYENWLNKPFIKITDKQIQQLLGANNNMVCYNSFIDANGNYKLQNQLTQVYAKLPANRTKHDKAIIKADDKINLCYNFIDGGYLRIFPVNSNNNLTWYNPVTAQLQTNNVNDSVFYTSILEKYFTELIKAKHSNNYTMADSIVNIIKTYQRQNALYQLPSVNKIKAEQAYYKYNVLGLLFKLYAIIGFILLIVAISSIVKGFILQKAIQKLVFITLIIAFILHTIPIVVRWYILGYVPLSNGYETMVFISWATILIGLIFCRQSVLTASVSFILASVTLMVSNLSFLDPELSNLVPVLKSGWLTMHVSVVTASYSFFGFSALIGIINLILITVTNAKNKTKVMGTIVKLMSISNNALVIGLLFLTAGAFLGAIWANESWGRYWGWDPKETWSVITIIVYTLISHSRFIPAFKTLYIQNVLSIVGFASVLMTFFGVNYLLSGLHSYAGGNISTMPIFVYYILLVLFLILVISYYSYKRNFRKNE